MKAFKVVRQLPGKLVSSWVHEAGFQLEYAVGMKTEPYLKGSKIFVFKHLSDAKNYVKTIKGRIFECEVPYLSPMKFMSWNNDTNIRAFWKTKLAHKRVKSSIMPCVSGAYQTAHVTLIKEIAKDA